MANEIVFRRLYADPALHGTAPLVFNESGEQTADLSAESRRGGIECRYLLQADISGESRRGGMETKRLYLAEISAELRRGGFEGRLFGGHCEIAGERRPIGGGNYEIDLDVPTGPSASCAAPSRAGGRVSAGWQARWQRPARLVASPAAALSRGSAAGSASDLSVPHAGAMSGRVVPVVAPGARAAAGLYVGYAAGLPRLVGAVRVRPALASERGAALALPYLHPPRRAAGLALGLGDGGRRGAGLVAPLMRGRRALARIVFPVRPGLPILPGRTPRPVIPPEPPPYQGRNDLIFGFPLGLGNLLIFNRRWRHITIVVPVRRVYRVRNSFDFYRLSDGLRLPALSASAGTGMDSMYWELSAGLASSQAAELLAPTGDGPAEVRLMINGIEWDFIIDPPRASDSSNQDGAPNTSGSISGRSLAAYLDEPHALVGVWDNGTEARTAQQLAEAVLPFGASLVWDELLEDWLVDAGAWSFRGTPAKAIARIAEAGGAVVGSARTGLGLTLGPRYPYLPWELAGATPYASIPLRYCASRGRSWRQQPDYNRVFIFGERGGLLGRVTRAGTAGDRPAPQVIDPLATAGAAIRQRGAAILGDTGLQVMESIAMPLTSETGLIPQGVVLEFVGAETWRGLVHGVSVAAKIDGGAVMDVEMVVDVERHYG